MENAQFNSFQNVHWEQSTFANSPWCRLQSLSRLENIKWIDVHMKKSTLTTHLLHCPSVYCTTEQNFKAIVPVSSFSLTLHSMHKMNWVRTLMYYCVQWNGTIVFGHLGKPESYWWYRLAKSKSMVWKWRTRVEVKDRLLRSSNGMQSLMLRARWTVISPDSVDGKQRWKQLHNLFLNSFRAHVPLKDVIRSKFSLPNGQRPAETEKLYKWNPFEMQIDSLCPSNAVNQNQKNKMMNRFSFFTESLVLILSF